MFCCCFWSCRSEKSFFAGAFFFSKGAGRSRGKKKVEEEADVVRVRVGVGYYGKYRTVGKKKKKKRIDMK